METSRRDLLQECGAGRGAVEDSEQKAVSVLTLLRRFVRVRSRPQGELQPSSRGEASPTTVVGAGKGTCDEHRKASLGLPFLRDLGESCMGRQRETEKIRGFRGRNRGLCREAGAALWGVKSDRQLGRFPQLCSGFTS